MTSYPSGGPESAAWAIRVTGRLAGSPDVFDTTINTVSPPESTPAVAATFEEAKHAIAAAAGRAVPITGPTLVDSATVPANAKPLANVVRSTTSMQSFHFSPVLFGDYCVGDLGDLPASPVESTFKAPCAATATMVHLRCFGFNFCSVIADRLHDVHTHTATELYSTLIVTGTLTTSHYKLVGEGAPSTLTVPIVLSPTGGSAFTSELTLTNRGATDAQVSYLYTPAFGGPGSAGTDMLPAERQRVIPDAIAYLEGLGVTNTGSAGTLRITFEGLSALDAASAMVRTTAAVPEGRAGLSYSGLASWKLLSAPAYLCGLRQNATDRSNVAVLNAGSPADGDVRLRLTVFSGDPADPRSKALPDITLSPGGFTQISGILVSNGLALPSGYVKVERVSGGAPFYSYGVINDQITSDGSFVEPVAASPVSPISSMTVPALVETSAYETELILTNVSSAPRTLRFTWASPSLTGGQAAFSIALLPGEQQLLPAFVQLLRERGVVTNLLGPSFAGALFALDDSGDLRGISIAARITTKTGGGRFGVFLPAYPSGSEATTSAWLYGLQQNAETRSNLALVNTGAADASPSTFRIDLFDGATGVKTGSLVTTVPARGFVQIDRILAVYAPGTGDGCALVTKISGDNPFLAYAVLNDGAEPGRRSGDGAFVTASIPAS
ncbi:MAG: hypothetical protein NEA02_17020 [Thermoanaerobaculia bacterium]|nr:hypothetical protein [Thermoanaerobaculia bacterium]